MKIKVYGSVSVTDDDVVVQGFHFDGEDGENMDDAARVAMEWAIRRLKEAGAVPTDTEEDGGIVPMSRRGGSVSEPTIEPWCKCDGMGGCLGCLIDGAVQREFGTEGLKYLHRHIETTDGPIEWNWGDDNPPEWLRRELIREIERRTTDSGEGEA